MFKNSLLGKRAETSRSNSFVNYNRTVPVYASTHKPCPDVYVWEKYIPAMTSRYSRNTKAYETNNLLIGQLV